MSALFQVGVSLYGKFELGLREVFIFMLFVCAMSTQEWSGVSCSIHFEKYCILQARTQIKVWEF